MGAEAVLEQVRAVLPDGMEIAGGGIAGIPLPSFARELAAVEHAVSRRRAEFFAGRFYAREALRLAGCAPQCIPMSASRAPEWPAGFVGSISHTEDWCIAVAARRRALLSVGIDLEPNTPLPAGTRPGIVSPRDAVLAGPQRLPAAVQADTLIFVIKEAAYKLYWPVCGCMLDFHDVSVAIDPGPGSFVARLGDHVPSLPGGSDITGRFGLAGGLLFAVAAWPAAQ